MRDAMDRFGWLIYRINQPAMRHLLMTPRNNLRMRDGVVSILAGNIRRGRTPDVPLLAFKTVYHVMSLGTRLVRGRATQTS